jgi:hypothetical protein
LHVGTVVREATVALTSHLDPSIVSPEARVVERNEASSSVAARDEVVANSLEAFDEVD